mgnify:CR=1 FL=1
MNHDYVFLLERAGFRQLQEEVARVTGLAVITTDTHGRPLLGKCNVSPFCALVNSTWEGKMACETFRRTLVSTVLSAGECRQVCHAGLISLGAPVGDQAVLIAGGVATGPLAEWQLARLAEEVRCSREELAERARQVPVWPGARLAEVGALVRTLASFAAGSLDSYRMFIHVLRLSDLIATEHREDVIISRVVRETACILDASVCLLRVYDEEKKVLVARGIYGIGEAVREAIREIPVDDTVAGAVFKAGRPVALPDIRTAGGKMLLPQLVPAVKSALIAPLRAGVRVLGTLSVYAAAPRVWDEATISSLAAIAAKMALALENARLYSALKDNYLSAVQALAAALEAKDVYTRGHSVRVARLARACARVLGLGTEEQEQVYLAALLHDIGKIGVADSILLKPGPLSADEWQEIRNHPVVGSRILEPASFPAAVVAAVRYHHEDYGGGGYPDGLVGEEIPFLARVIRVADAYDAMTSARPYRPALTRGEALAELQQGVGRQFDPRVVAAFLRISGEEIKETGGEGGTLITLLTEVLSTLGNFRGGVWDAGALQKS